MSREEAQPRGRIAEASSGEAAVHEADRGIEQARAALFEGRDAGDGARFARDFLRLRRDLRDAEHLAACMERINLVTAEKVRELSRLNNSLYECLLREEARPEHDQVVSHVIIKADVRGSTKMTQDLLGSGTEPRFALQPESARTGEALLDRFRAKKVFIEGDAIVLAIFETESTRAYARAVAKACVLSRQILAVCNSYNDRAVRRSFRRWKSGLAWRSRDPRRPIGRTAIRAS